MRTFRKDSFDYSKVVDVVVDMKPVEVRPGPVKLGGRRRSSIVNKPPENFCIQCLSNVSFLPHVHCLECKRADVVLCLSCFQLGAEIGEHVRGHNYEIPQRCGPSVFQEDPNEGPCWGSLEDERLLSLIRTYKLDDWPKIAFSEFGRVRTVEEALNHFSRCFLNSVISEISIEDMTRPPIHAFGLGGSEVYTGEFFKPTPSDELKSQMKELYEQLPDQQLSEVNCAEFPAIRLTRLSETIHGRLEDMICEFSHVHVEHNPEALAEQMYGQPRCFIRRRFTHLHRSPNQRSTFAGNKTPIHDHLNQTPRSHKLSSLQAPELQKMENEAESNDANQVAKSQDDNNGEHLPNKESPFACSGNNYDDKHQTSVFTFPSQVYEDENSSASSKSPLRDIAISCSPPPPILTSHADEADVTLVTDSESPQYSGNEDNPTEAANHGYDVRQRTSQRRRETFSYSPPKVRHRSGGRGRRKRKMGLGRLQKAETSNGIMEVVPPVEVRTPRPKSYKRPSIARISGEYLSTEEAMTYRLMNPTLKFVTRDPPLLTKQLVRRFDADDLNLIAYNPKRDDFEHEYRNGGEHFISKIFLNGECLISSEIEEFKNAIRVAKVQRYNRILERRFSNHAVVREHQLLNEFFSIVKTNVNERGKYTLFAGESFPSRKRAEECRPYFAKMRRVLGSQEVLDLAEDIAEMENVMARIRMLRALQLSGTTELKGRFKSEVVFSPRGRKRRTRKADGELRRAGLRWERIKRWNKKVNETS